MSAYEAEKVLITVKAYPAPARRTVEVSCTAGITEEGKWIRLLIPYRLLEFTRRFAKYQWISGAVTKSTRDPRQESYNVDLDSLRVIGPPLSTSNRWQARKQVVSPLLSPSLCHLIRTRHETGTTLGIFKPKEISRLIIQPEEEPNWTAEQLRILSQESMFGLKPRKLLEKIPFKFTYVFSCDDPECRGHRLSIVDWEAAEAYRRWRARYGDLWQATFRQKFETQMIHHFDTHFYVGTLRAHPDRWIIVGLFYPPW
jgi:hypothetical protein